MREIKTDHLRFFVAPIDRPDQSFPNSPEDRKTKKFGCFASLSGLYLDRQAQYLLIGHKTEQEAEIALPRQANIFLSVLRSNLTIYLDEAKDLILKVTTTPQELTQYRIRNPDEQFLAHNICSTNVSQAQEHLKNILDNTCLDQPDGCYTFHIGEVAVGDLDYTRFRRYKYHLHGPDRIRLAEFIWATDILQAQIPMKELLDSKPNALEGVYLLYHNEQLVTAHTYRRDKSQAKEETA